MNTTAVSASDADDADQPGADTGDAEVQRAIAVTANGRAWELIGRASDLTALERDELLDAAHASAYHWKQVGEPANQVRAQWLIAKANTELGHGPAALRHATRCLGMTEAAAADVQDFDWAYAHEAMARAYAISGDVEQANTHYRHAQARIEAIGGQRDRELAVADLAEGNWANFTPPADA